MSREERKMAQIIASIERMEQRKTPTSSSATSARADASADSDSAASSGSGSGSAAATTGPGARTGTGANATTPNDGVAERTVGIECMNSNEIQAQAQKSSTRLGAKGRKLKPLATAHGGSKAKVKSGGGGNKRAKTPQELVVDKKVIVDCKLTPKKRWIQLWTEQLSSSSDEAVDADVGSSGKSKDDVDKSSDGSGDGGASGGALEPADEKSASEPEREPPRVVARDDSQSHHSVDAPTLAVAPTVSVAALPAMKAALARSPEQLALGRLTIAPEEPACGVGGEEREEGEEPQSAESVQPDASLASPSPQTDDQKDTSISPVSSVKESLKDASSALAAPKKSEERVVNVATPTDAPAAAAAVAVSGAESQPAAAKSAQPTEVAGTSRADALGDAGADDTKRAAASRQSVGAGLLARASPSAGLERSRKRSLERKESEPLTEEERRRAERRRQRKSNWDVGDPRFAARNGDKQSPSCDDITSSNKFPAGRPAWRHSNSMDAAHNSGKSSFVNNVGSLHRSSFSGGGSGAPRRGFYSSNSLPLDRSRSAGRSSSGYHYSNSYR